MTLRTMLRAGTSASAFALAMLALPQAVSAQETDVAADEDGNVSDMIIVTGFRAALESAADLKRDAPVIAEAFSAEDIGKLPDVSIAETVACPALRCSASMAARRAFRSAVLVRTIPIR